MAEKIYDSEALLQDPLGYPTPSLGGQNDSIQSGFTDPDFLCSPSYC